MQAVLETDTFSNSAKTIGLTESERHEIATRIGDNPKIGDLIKGTGGARKMRFPRQGRGKSSGYRVITYFAGEDVPVFLLDVYAKGERIDLTQAERNELRKHQRGIAEDYRAAMQSRASRISEKAS